MSPARKTISQLIRTVRKMFVFYLRNLDKRHYLYSRDKLDLQPLLFDLHSIVIYLNYLQKSNLGDGIDDCNSSGTGKNVSSLKVNFKLPHIIFRISSTVTESSLNSKGATYPVS